MIKICKMYSTFYFNQHSSPALASRQHGERFEDKGTAKFSLFENRLYGKKDRIRLRKASYRGGIKDAIQAHFLAKNFHFSKTTHMEKKKLHGKR